jgi:uncharacterized membrane protein
MAPPSQQQQYEALGSSAAAAAAARQRGDGDASDAPYPGPSADAHALPLVSSLLLFAASLAAFVALDGVWLGLVARKFYASHLGPAGVLRPDADLLAAALSWGSIVAANFLFVLPRTAGFRPALVSLRQGFVLGLCLYGTVDFTNCALIRGWGWPVALVDVIWGGMACAITALLQNRLHAALSAGR